MEKYKEQIKISDAALALLEWIGQWTPQNHKDDWDRRKSYPPGFRFASDMSSLKTQASLDILIQQGGAYSASHKAAFRTKSVPPIVNSHSVLCNELLPHRLVEGWYTYGRLTKRGRSFLITKGRSAPDVLKSHCTEIFDDVVLSEEGETMEDHLYRCRKHKNEDNIYNREGDHPQVVLTTSNGRTFLNGSLREHSRVSTLTVKDSDGRQLVSLSLSLESLAAMLTGTREVDCTLNQYISPEGVTLSQPACSPVSPSERMQARLEKQTDTQMDRIAAIEEKIASSKLGKRAKADILQELDSAKRLGPDGLAWVATQTMEEVAKVVEGAVSTVQTQEASQIDANPMGLLGLNEEG